MFHTRNIDFFYEIDFIIINRVISLIMKINVDVYDYVDFINDFLVNFINKFSYIALKHLYM